MIDLTDCISASILDMNEVLFLVLREIVDFKIKMLKLAILASLC